VYDKLDWVHFEAKDPQLTPDGSVDAVVTFRNVHNWAQAGTTQSMFEGFYKALKSGGTNQKWLHDRGFCHSNG